METESFENLGNRIKEYEMLEDHKLMADLPVIARLDGRAFHTFTKGLARPYDTNFMKLMQETTKFLVEKNHANLGYTQSDEITLCFLPERVPFNRRIQKLGSVLASMAGAFFNTNLLTYLPSKKNTYPHFDCRVFAVPRLEEVFNVFRWRELDASRNSLTLLAQAYFSHKELYKKRSKDKHEMLYSKGVNWNNEPEDFKKGSYFKRVIVTKHLSDEELDKIPEKYRSQNSTITRHAVEKITLPILKTMPWQEFIEKIQ